MTYTRIRGERGAATNTATTTTVNTDKYSNNHKKKLQEVIFHKYLFHDFFSFILMIKIKWKFFNYIEVERLFESFSYTSVSQLQLNQELA